MTLRRCRLGKAEIIDLYVRDHRTMEEIGVMVGVNRSTIQRHLKTAGISSLQGAWVEWACSWEPCGKSIRVLRSKFHNHQRNYCNRHCHNADQFDSEFDTLDRRSELNARAVVAPYFHLEHDHVMIYRDKDLSNISVRNLLVVADKGAAEKYLQGRRVKVLFDGACLPQPSHDKARPSEPKPKSPEET